MALYRRVSCVLLLLAVAGSQFSSNTAQARTVGSHAAKLKGVAATMDTWLRSLTNKGQFQGTVLVARKGTVLLKKGYGQATRVLPDTAGTMFDIASITKQFTAMAVLQLQDRGKLSVQDRLCQYLNGCPDTWKPITLHMLLTHTSGIPDFPDRSIDITKPMPFDQILAWLEKEPLDFAPGARFSYSNSGYDLLGYVIDKVSGQSWASFLQQNIFDPLGMKHTGVESASTTIPGLADGYATILGTTALPAPPFDPSLVSTSGSLYSTVGDLYTWDQALSSDKLVSKAALDAMFTPYVPLSDGNSTHYGYGWMIASVSNHKLIFHDGALPGFRSINVMAPGDGLTVIVLSNVGTADATDIGIVLTADVLGINVGIQAA